MSRFLVLLFLMLAAPAHAEAIPDYALNKDFENCMGGESPQQDPGRAAYCNCVRDGMRSWDLDAYGAAATEAATAGSNATPKKIEDLAQGCLAKVLK